MRANKRLWLDIRATGSYGQSTAIGFDLIDRLKHTQNGRWNAKHDTKCLRSG
jgi:hypothetical protein